MTSSQLPTPTPPRPGTDRGPNSYASGRPPSPDELLSGSPYFRRTTYLPTTEQLARDEALKRQNRRTIYIPVILAALIAIGLFILLFVIAFGIEDQAQAREFIAGMSALTVILMTIPLILLATILPIAYLAWWYNRREQRKLYPETGPMAYRSRLQILLWQLDSFLIQAQRQVERGSDAIAEPLIRAHKAGAYGQEFAEGLKRNFTRSETNDYNYYEPPTSD